MAEGLRPVSILGVGFGWTAFSARHWRTALTVALTPLGYLLALWGLFVLLPIKPGVGTPVAAFVLVGGVVLVGLGADQLLVRRALLGGARLWAAPRGWMGDLGRILVVALTWTVIAAAVQIGLSLGLNQIGLRSPAPLYDGLSYGLGLTMLALPALWMELTVSAVFQQRRWLLVVRPPPWPDLWRILVGWALLSAQVVAIWWLVNRAHVWSRALEWRAVSPSLRPIIPLVWSGAPLGLTVLLMTVGGTQAWRQSLGREDEDPTAVFD